MKKRVLTVIFAVFAAFSAKSEQVLWSGLLYTGYSSNSQIKNSNGTTIATLENYFTDYPEINTVKISLNNSYLDMRGSLGYTELYIDISEQMSEYDPGSEWMLNNVSFSDIIVMEIGYIDYEMGDEDDPSTWDNFHLVASSEPTSLQNLYDGTHVSINGDINPPPSWGPWIPTVFYTDVPIPEPSSLLLLALGACAILLKGRNGIHE